MAMSLMVKIVQSRLSRVQSWGTVSLIQQENERRATIGLVYQ
ncbi:Uncharacterised protein [Vibrio mimicus]|nr:Uncharacterised protein [Vibrio mimicus]